MRYTIRTHTGHLIAVRRSLAEAMARAVLYMRTTGGRARVSACPVSFYRLAR